MANKLSYTEWEAKVLAALDDMEALAYCGGNNVKAEQVLKGWYEAGFSAGRVAKTLNARLAAHQAHPIDLDELRTRFYRMVASVRAEREAREGVFRNKPQKRESKCAEMDTLLDDIIWMKEQLKPFAEAKPEQQPLLDVPPHQWKGNRF